MHNTNTFSGLRWNQQNIRRTGMAMTVITLLVMMGLTACSSTQPVGSTNNGVLQAMAAAVQADSAMPVKAHASLPIQNVQTAPQPTAAVPYPEAQQPAAVQAEAAQPDQDPIQTPEPVALTAETLPIPADSNPSPEPPPAQNLLPADQLPSEAPTKGHLAPDFTLQTIDGASIHLAELRGKPVILNYWSSWCIPCQQELPDLEKLRAEFQGTEIAILSINAIEQDKIADVQGMIAKYSLTSPILLDKGAAFYDAYNVLFFPTSFFIDSNGIITEVLLGGATQEEFRQRIQGLLKGS